MGWESIMVRRCCDSYLDVNSGLFALKKNNEPDANPLKSSAL